MTSQPILNAGKKCREESWVVFVLSGTVRCLSLQGSADPRCPAGQEDEGNAPNMT